MSAGFRALRVVVLATVLAASAACQPRLTEDDLRLEVPHATCALELVEVPGIEAAPHEPRLDPRAQHTLQLSGRAVGEVSARGPASTYVERLTHDGYWLRKTSASLVMGLGFLCLGALAAAFLLTIMKKRPPPRWGLELAKSVAREAEAVRALATHGDALTKDLVQRTEEVLGQATVRADQLASRCRPLEERAESATALAHLESLYGQLEGLLGRVERAHMHITGWSERRGRDEDETVKAQIAHIVAELQAALTEVGT